MIMHKHEYDQIIRENFDLSDNYTRQFIVNLDEAGQEQLITALSSALYDKIVSKVDEIDFGTIPKSRGDIREVQGFVNTEQCIDIIRKLVIQYNQKTDVIDVVISAISNIKERKDLFVKAFNVKSDMPIMIYNLMVLAIERSVSLLIATCIEFVKDPNTATVKTALDTVAYKKTMDDMLFKQLITFNGLCKSGAMDQTLKASLVSTKNVHEEVDIVGTILNDGPRSNPYDTDDNAADVFNFSDDKPQCTPDGECEDKFAVFDPDNQKSVTFDLDPNEPEPENPMICGAIRTAFASVDPENIPQVTPEDPEGVPAAITEDELNEDGIGSLVGNLIGKGARMGMDKLRSTSGSKSDDGIVTCVKNLAKNNKKVFTTAAIIASVVAIPFVVVKVIIPFIRTATYYFYYSKMKFSDYLQIQAEFFEANAATVENSEDDTMTEEERKKVVEKQRKWAERLYKWSNAFNIDKKQAENATTRQEDKDSKEKSTIGKDEDGDDSIF